jgi:hypothetical protein
MVRDAALRAAPHHEGERAGRLACAAQKALDHEYMMQPSEAPVLKKKPSEYMRDMYYSSQPMEIQDRDARPMKRPPTARP